MNTKLKDSILIENFLAVARALELAIGWVFSSSWLPPQDFEFFKWLIIPGYGYGFILITLGICELIRPQDIRPWSRKSLLSGTYLIFAGKLSTYSIIVAPAIRQLWLYLGLPSLHLDQHLSWPLYMVVTLVVITFVGYWSHRLMHRIPLFWNIHKIHHSVQNLNCASVYHFHFLEMLLHAPFHTITVLALGTDLVAPFGIIFKFIDIFGHSNVRVNTGILTYFISTPQAHRFHHSCDPKHYNTNFSNTFMWWDHVFGTFYYDPKNPPTAFGINEDVPDSFFKQQILPFFWMGKRIRQAYFPLSIGEPRA